MKTEYKEVKLEDLVKEMGPDLMGFLMESLHTAVHQDAQARLDKPEKSNTSE